MLQFVNVVTFIGFVETLLLFLYAARYYVFALISPRKTQSKQPNQTPRDPKEDAFVSVLLPMYNEANVVERLMKFCTAFEFPSYEVIVIDDSTDATTKKLEAWRDDPRVTILHRDSREGWKGGALNVGLEHIDARSTHALILDADFVPPADLLQRFLSTFESEKVVAVQGYQVHDINAEENWITRGIRIMYSLNNVVELSAKDRLGLLLPLTGSVYMVRTDVLKKVGFEGGITEDWEFTLKLYEAGYKVAYDATLTASAECANTIRKFLTQTARWAEGHTRAFRRHFGKMMRSHVLTTREKLEFLFQGCLYLNSILVLALSLGGFLMLPSYPYSLSRSSTISSLIFTAINLSALAFAITVALHRENRVKDVVNMPYTLLLGYLSVPAVAWASLKGLLTSEGRFRRTYKTGNITKPSILQRLMDRFKT
jgi:biofilm PGA synthesis N-glycosyltransferase PgaC